MRLNSAVNLRKNYFIFSLKQYFYCYFSYFVIKYFTVMIMFRKTKIVCTIGPASGDTETIEKMCKAGMNVARLNFSHNTHEDHAQ